MPALELLISPPGTGKTSYCIELFKNEITRSRSGIDSRSFFVLPSCEHADRIRHLILKEEIVGHRPAGALVAGLFNAEIVTINDLSARLLGLSVGQNPNDTIRRGLIRDLLTKSGLKFPYFDPVREARGFHDLLVDTVKEFKASLLTIPEFETRAQTLLKDPVFKAKLRDFTVLVKNYEIELRRLGLQEPEDSIGEIAKRARHSHSTWLPRRMTGRFLKRPDLVIFDGFYHFTRAQRRLIEVIAAWSKHTLVTLTLSGSGAKRSTLFEYPERTRTFLLSAGFKEKKRKGIRNYRTRDAALLHLEKNIFAEPPAPFKERQGSVTLFRAASARGEIEMIARRIKRLYREETSLDYSDICLVLRSLGGYEKIIEAVFDEFGIPVHIHERKRLIEHGFSKTLHHFLSLTAGGWKRADVAAVIKSSYLAARFASGEALELESKALAENILEGRERWEAFAPLGFLLETESALRLSKNIREFNRKLLEFVRGFSLAGAVDGEALKSLEAILKSAEVYYGPARERDFSGAPQSFDVARFMVELRESLETGLFSMRPEGKNRVQVYDIVMALPKEYKVVFLAGLLEKRFPLAVSEDALFKDAERRAINAPRHTTGQPRRMTVARGGEVLEERLSRIAGERYFFYMGLARAGEKLFLSYPSYGEDGKPSLASFFVEEAHKCFEGGLPEEVKEPDEFLPRFEEWESEADVKRGLAVTLFGSKPRPPLLPDLLKHWAGRNDLAEILRMGFEGERAILKDARTLEAAGREKGPFSATRLEKFATCAFKYFAGETLGLKEPLEGRERIDMGVLLHKALEEYYKALDARERQEGSYLSDPGRVEKALCKKLDEAYADHKLHKLYREPLYRQKIYLDSMQKTLALFVAHEKELFERRHLVPEHFELTFDALKIEDEGREPITLRGQIDRIDRARIGDDGLVVDYKRSRRDVPLSDKLEDGLEFQLPVYILAAERLLKLKIIGAEHRILREAKARGLYRERAEELLKLNSKKGIYSDEAFEGILQDAESRIRRAVRRIRGGDIEVKSKSCEWCHFFPVCRFEKWRLVYSKEETP